MLTLADCGGFLLREYLRTGTTRPVSAAVSAFSVGGSRVERMLTDLLEARAVELAES